VVRRMHTYAKAYSLGMNGTAALAGAPIASARPVKRSPRRTPAHTPERAARGLRLPVWVVLVALAALVFTLSFMLLGVRAQVSQAAKRASALGVELSGVQEIIGSLEVKIAEANDPQRIHSIAVNRLKMRQPTEDQIRVVPRPYDYAAQTLKAEAQPKDRGFFSLLLSLVGL